MMASRPHVVSARRELHVKRGRGSGREPYQLGIAWEPGRLCRGGLRQIPLERNCPDSFGRPEAEMSGGARLIGSTVRFRNSVRTSRRLLIRSATGFTVGR
jgi:hypothetical protein